ncbi:dihydroorotate dehydrogenase (NAD+) catalytic subunit [Carnobacterium iners]|uniref:Dihydroorotate dehydrogenase n=1 Tax=Carnobacterium iners TaxID=1073423 RepID=A0A1X7NF13_9LACT|nr:dihydroorotate dehydrogenase [Carnobacterium iners]SEK39018.1 dihydroorotate dehydrogenase (NAD+) catalytic subunit [Carnobacterium iners]SMH36327.1 dihydroorotate dehydrogenase (NAD+) catalytic subunit [Carnobacterium iners]
MNQLSVNLPGLHLKNPIMPSSGTFGFGERHMGKFDYNILGAIIIKSTTSQARTGNPEPTYHQLDTGILNAIGLKNPGVDVIVNEKLPALKDFDTPVIASVAGNTTAEFVEVTKKLCQSPYVKALELNVSCPNVAEGGLTFGSNPESVRSMTEAVKKVATVPVYVKLTPNVTDIVAIAQAAEQGGADGISMINTFSSMAIDLETRKPILSNKTGGLSGPGIKPIAIRMIYQVSRAVSIPIIGMGGVSTVDDVLEMIIAGASAVAIGTAQYNNPLVCKELIEGLPIRMKELGIESIEGLIKEVKEGRLNEN